MSDLDDLVRHETEHTGVDFKRSQYTKQQHEALLKDVLSMANAHTQSDRYIICGVALNADGSRTISGIVPQEFVDAAIYQQLVAENIEPDIHLEYFPYDVDGATVGIFRISRCTEQPYTMRKDFGTGLRRGDMWIRKGSHQVRLSRPDLERIYAERNAAAGFSGAVVIAFDGPGEPTTLSLPATAAITLPSDYARAKIRRILAGRATAKRMGLAAELLPLMPVYFGSRTYDQYSTAELEKELNTVDETYREDDEYALYSRYSHILNLTLHNTGVEYVENARLELTVASVSGVTIFDREYDEPFHGSPLDRIGHMPRLRLKGDPSYPNVSHAEGVTRIVQDIGDLRHGLPTPAFGVPLRILLAPEAVGRDVVLECSLHGKNLRRALTTTLTIHVVPPDGSHLEGGASSDDSDDDSVHA